MKKKTARNSFLLVVSIDSHQLVTEREIEVDASVDRGLSFPSANDANNEVKL